MIAPRAVFVLALIAIMFPVAAAGRATIDAPARDLRICVDPDNPPLSMNRVAAQPGVDVDVGQAIAERLDLLPRLVWVDTTYGGRALRRSLLAGQCDVFMGLPIDPAAETDGALALTRPYYSTGYRLIGLQERSDAGSLASDLRNGRIGVERQSGAHMRLEQMATRLVVYGNQPEVLDAVARGEVDAGAIWLSDVDRLLQGRLPAMHALAGAAPEPPLRWNMAIGVRVDDVNLRASVNRVVDDLLADGRIKAIFNRYGVPFYAPITDR